MKNCPACKGNGYVIETEEHEQIYSTNPNAEPDFYDIDVEVHCDCCDGEGQADEFITCITCGKVHAIDLFTTDDDGEGNSFYVCPHCDDIAKEF